MRLGVIFTVLVILALSVLFNYCLCVIVSDAERTAAIERERLEKERKKMDEYKD